MSGVITASNKIAPDRSTVHEKPTHGADPAPSLAHLCFFIGQLFSFCTPPPTKQRVRRKPLHRSQSVPLKLTFDLFASLSIFLQSDFCSSSSKLTQPPIWPEVTPQSTIVSALNHAPRPLEKKCCPFPLRLGSCAQPFRSIKLNKDFALTNSAYRYKSSSSSPTSSPSSGAFCWPCSWGNPGRRCRRP